MSDRIGVLRGGRFVQVGTPQEIYARPVDKFVSEFMGDVNVLRVALEPSGLLRVEDVGATVVPPPLPAGFASGWLIIRPEYLSFVDGGERPENTLRGKLYNEYVLGSRIQYQVRVGAHVFTVEKLRQQTAPVTLDSEVTIGWNAADGILVTE